MEETKEPKFFNAPKISNMFGISRAEGRKFVKLPDCPFLVLRISRRIIIPANNFFDWYESLAQGTIAENEDVAE